MDNSAQHTAHQTDIYLLLLVDQAGEEKKGHLEV